MQNYYRSSNEIKNIMTQKKLKSIVESNLYLPREEIERKFGKPNTKSGEYISFFEEHSCFGLLKNEIGFIFDKNIAVDIFLTQYLIGIDCRTIFYYKNSFPEYKTFYTL
ncbi:hypothetical protein [Chryseobacterium formosense]|uniref:hypothetical protein n=1 Tax=Chryseobacterium formosense TaxID=236814 RepID=UPI00103FA9D0|nr:hypothetical protein [Chryseobacterium formosense]